MHDLVIKIQNLSACSTDYYSMLTTLSYSYSHFPPRQTEVSMTRKIQNISKSGMVLPRVTEVLVTRKIQNTFQFQAGNNIKEGLNGVVAFTVIG